MTTSWKSKDNTIYTPPAALSISPIQAASPLFSRGSLIYTIMSSTKRGGNQSCALYFNLNRKGTVLCFSPLPFYYCLVNGNASNKCPTRAININVDLSIWEKREQDCSLLAQIWHWQMKRWDSITSPSPGQQPPALCWYPGCSPFVFIRPSLGLPPRIPVPSQPHTVQPCSLRALFTYLFHHLILFSEKLGGGLGEHGRGCKR